MKQHLKNVAEQLNFGPHHKSYRALHSAYWRVRRRPYRRSYSQFAEDLVMAGLLDLTTTGSYLDVGSGHPIRGSNSYLFYQHGWAGTLVEPIRSHVQRSQLFRPRDTTIQACASDQQGHLSFSEFYPPEFSTTELDVRTKLIARGGTLVAEYKVECLVLATLNLEVSPDDNFFFSLDVEGHELLAINGVDWGRFRPRVVCIEDWRATDNSAESDVAAKLTSIGYQKVAQLGFSSIFVQPTSQEHLEK